MKTLFTNIHSKFKDMLYKKPNESWYTVKGKKFKIFKYGYAKNTSGTYKLNNLVVTDILNRHKERNQYSILKGTEERITDISLANNTISISCKINESPYYNTLQLKDFLNSASSCTDDLKYCIWGDEIVFTISTTNKLLEKIKYFRNILINSYITISDKDDIQELLVTIEKSYINYDDSNTEYTSYDSKILYAYLYSGTEE